MQTGSIFRAFCILTALLGFVFSAMAQSYPSRPITIVYPFAAGGPGDVIGRVIAERMRISLGQAVIIENVAGANGTIGTGRVARASPNGYTLVLGLSSTHVLNGAIYALAYDVLNDFEPISLVANSPQIMAARKAMPAKDLMELIAWLKENPNRASQGYAGAGSPGHIAGLFFQKQTGTRFQFVPYRGLGPASQDLVAGQIDLMFTSPTVILPALRSSMIKAYVVSAKNRLASAPDIPTANEAGLPDFYTSTWFALWAPKATPRTVVDRLNTALVEALADPSVRERLSDLGLEIFPREQQTPEALADFHKAEIKRWWPIIREAGIKPE